MSSLPDTHLNSRDFARIARAIRFIDTHFAAQPRLAEVAAHVALSPFHFNRLFRRWAGLTPKQYLASVTARAAARALECQRSVLEAAHEVGLSGPGRLHDLIVQVRALTPGELKMRGAGVRITHGHTETPFGTALVAETSRGILHLGFVEEHGMARAERELRASWPAAEFARDDERARALGARIWGPADPVREPLRLALAGTNFQVRVWEALLKLAPRTWSYGELAAAMGEPHKTRAVAGAVAANTIAWLIPCHHVLRKGGALGGYRWGGERKYAMLAWERLHGRLAAPRPATTEAASEMRELG
jgi:AraC family transcriptional regulator, regulatory protein of adaptative response / methylated-DNA-[protein]-cysteine methyltransferase